MKIVFMGTPQAAVPSLERLIAEGHEIVAVYTQPDRPSGRGNKIVYSPVKAFALIRGLAVFQPVKIKTPEEIDSFRSHAADIAVVVAYGRILPEAYLTAFKNGAINVHFSLLPNYRGAAPVNWAIVNGETETAVTTMKMDTGLDTGDILLQSKTAIEPDETSIELMERLSMIGADVLMETLTTFEKISPRQQDHSAASYAPVMKKEDGLIDWKMTATQLVNRVRGFQPFPSAFTFFNGSQLTLWKAVATMNDEASAAYAPGTVIMAKGDELHVSCGGETILALSELQPEGKRKMDVRDFINGVRPAVGERFG